MALRTSAGRSKKVKRLRSGVSGSDSASVCRGSSAAVLALLDEEVLESRASCSASLLPRRNFWNMALILWVGAEAQEVALVLLVVETKELESLVSLFVESMGFSCGDYDRVHDRQSRCGVMSFGLRDMVSGSGPKVLISMRSSPRER